MGFNRGFNSWLTIWMRLKMRCSALHSCQFTGGNDVKPVVPKTRFYFGGRPPWDNHTRKKMGELVTTRNLCFSMIPSCAHCTTSSGLLHLTPKMSHVALLFPMGCTARHYNAPAKIWLRHSDTPSCNGQPPTTSGSGNPKNNDN